MRQIPLGLILAGLLALPVAAAGSSPAPALVSLDQVLTQTLRDKAQGRLAPDRCAEFSAKFRADLAAAKASVPSTTANTDLHARILARLGEFDRFSANAVLAPRAGDTRSALSRIRFKEKTTPAVIAEERAILGSEPFNDNRAAQDAVEAEAATRKSHSALVDASHRAAANLLANLPTPPAPLHDGQAPTSSESAGLAFTAALGAAGAMLLFGGWGGKKLEERLPGIKIQMGMAAALGGVLATAGIFLVPAAPLASRPEVVNEVPQLVARVIPLKDGMRLSGMIGPSGQPSTFVTATEDIASTPAAQLAERLGIDSAPRYAIIRFPTPSVEIASRIAYNESSLFIGRGLTSGGAREFQVPNVMIPPNSTIEIVKAVK